MNRLNFGFYSHIHQLKHQFVNRSLCESQWDSIWCYVARLSFHKRFVLVRQAGILSFCLCSLIN